MSNRDANSQRVEKAAAECLRRAKALIPDTEHWWQQSSADEMRPIRCHCPVTAMMFAKGRRSRTLYLTLYGYYANAINTGSIADWNDAPERTLAEVHAAFDRAIALAEEGK